MKYLASLLVSVMMLTGCTNTSPGPSNQDRINEQKQREYDRKMVEYETCINNTFNRINNGELIFGVSGSTQSVYDYCSKYRP